MATIIDLRHYLTDSGSIPEHIPAPAHHFALYIGSIGSWVTSHPAGHYVHSNVLCRRSPGRRRCLGTIEAGFGRDGSTIIWQCPICGDNGTIRGWEGTMWDRRQG